LHAQPCLHAAPVLNSCLCFGIYQNATVLPSPLWSVFTYCCAAPFPPSIRSNALESALFIKTPHTACGSVGVVTYDLLNNDSSQRREKIAVMFSNPYDFNSHSNLYAVGVFDVSRECDENLYHEMYYETNDSFVRSKPDGKVLSYRGKEVTINATMSDAYQAVIKVELSEMK
uniref:DELTA-sagatoxin-Srs1a n=1 Tax=Salarias fasciatus TaxID=181472 RepID=A0A672FKH7_SALFA